ncbi:MAG: hypothetical protein H7641_11060 [Candidatus Heimdallarchaeota archaeon]|nr:hypothetical protein [Candidatus Heimdallarchaeota archaeon]MCK4878100.1 hypothetical protein [Candidatus Heimdallarchaeota archaeon]
MEVTSEGHRKNEDLVVRLGKLEEEISFLKKKRDGHNQLTKEALTKRNEFNQQINEGLARTKEYTSKRDDLNSQVKQLKQKRKELQEKVMENKKVLEEVVEKDQALNKDNIRRKRRSMRGLNEKINKIEWDLQTSVLTPEKEKEMIQLLEKLSEQLNKIAEEIHITSQQTQMWREISAAQREINILHIQIIDAAKESQIYHNLMNQSYHQINGLRKQANDLHKNFLNFKKQSDTFHRDFLSKVAEKSELKGELREVKQKVRAEIRERKQANLKENTKKAYEKYEKGENLSLDEFRLLVEKGMI